RVVSWRTRPLWLWGERDVVHRRPHGVVAVIGTWNYPVFLNAVQIVQALTAGNGVVWKPSEVAPRTAEALHRLLLAAGYPPELVERLPATREAGPAVAEADVDHVVFTGSAEVGRKLAARLGERLVGSTMELSGCDAMFVLPDADVRFAARAAWFGAVLNRGQTCLAVRRVFVHRGRYAEFLDRLRPQVEKAEPVALVLDAQREQAERLVRDALASGARRLVEPPGVADGRFPPTALADARPEMAVCREASFAPLLAVMPFDNLEHALAMDALCPFGLGASVFTANAAQAELLAARLRVGVVTVNDVIAPTGHPATPFGGRRDSGWGVTQGAEGLLAMTVPQSVSSRRDKFRPHYAAAAPDPDLAETGEGLLKWSHGKGVRQRLGGLLRLMRGGSKLRKKERGGT
ncbi:MAG TPA: aldehyde dehydrogenase family protein, partial [Gemmataceae bacterium]